ncbi:hypothetical protein LTR24_005622 [Lithohypha guttulata]|uniref:Uncharacterized protein n=1 Tax=Lithohypha guttulata TaxID=1690604 RepID=A0ABR0K8L7_9EURO|nr:hypothetical protein LTR24_005622 [Lithohypha guttulata]
MATAPQARQALIDNPPPKCPYFTLPDVCHFPQETRASKARKKTGYVSIVALWGPPSKMTEETTTDFLLQLLKHSYWRPDFEAVATEWQLGGTSYVKSRLRTIVEGKGYKLIGESKVVDGGGPPKIATPLPSKVVKAKKPKTTDKDGDGDADKATKASKAKKRKMADDTGVTKSKRTKKQKQAGKATGSKRGRSAAESQHETSNSEALQEPPNAAGTGEASGTDDISQEDEPVLDG